MKTTWDKILDLTDLPWPEVSVPKYSEGKWGRWRLEGFNVPLLRGYWRGLRPIFSRCYRLFKDDVLWMSSTPMELESQQHAVASFSGKVVIAGAGLGITIYNAVNNPKVRSVDVIEIDFDVIDFIEDQAAANNWENWYKVRWLHDDATKLRPEIPRLKIDFLWVDIWETMGTEKAPEDVRKIQQAIKAEKVGWWGMEIDFVAYLQHLGRTPPPILSDWEKFTEFSRMPLMRAEGQFERAAEAARNVYLA